MDPEAVDDLRSSTGDSRRGAEGTGTDDGGESAAGDEPSALRADSGRAHHGGTEDPVVLDFSANTNPRTPEGVARVYEAALSAARSYPSDDYYELRAAAAEYAGCDGTSVIPTAGGLAAIRLTIATTVESDDDVLVPEPSFGEYAREVRLQGGDVRFRAHDAVVDADPGRFELVVLCNPNNPTGDACDPDELRAFADRCRDAGTPLLVDEAFADFTDLPSLAGREGVVVARSLTKIFGLPGLRAGFAVATGEYRDRLETARPAWGLSSVAAAIGAHCLRQTAFVDETRERVTSERERMRKQLSSRFDVSPSVAPFLLLDAGSSAAVDEVVEQVREYDIAVRDARTFRGLDSHVRVAVRLPYENDLLLDALDV